MLRAEKLAFCRMYSGFGEIWRGFSKNSFRFLDADRKMGAQVFLASFFVLNWLPASIMLASAERWIALAAFLTLPVWLLAPWYGGVTAVLAPLGIYGFQLIALNGLILGLTKRKTTWKGRPV
jgi:hypothetical protein